jgi:hypothetical protein
MEQTTLNRGHIAFIEDQTHAAAEAFRAGELADAETILESVASYITAQLLAWRSRKQ